MGSWSSSESSVARSRLRLVASSWVMSWPPINTEPAVGWSRPLSSSIRVLLPDPEGPTIAIISPALTTRSALRRAATDPRSLG